MPAYISDLHRLIASTGRHRDLRAGDAVFHEGDTGEVVHASIAGRFKVVVTTLAGRELVLGITGPGAVFGELSALDGQPRSASVVALEPSTVAMLTREELFGALTRSPELAIELLRSITADLRLATSMVAERVDTPAAVRAARRLVDLARVADQAASTSSTEVRLPITQYDLAGLIGATREATARALAAMREDGLITTGRGSIAVIDRDGLARMARG